MIAIGGAIGTGLFLGSAISVRLAGPGVIFSFLAAGAIAIPLEPIPGIDLAYDVAVPIALIWYWFTFFRDARRTVSHTPSQKAVTYRQSK